MAGCNDGPTSIAIPTPRPFIIQDLRQPVTITAAGGTITLRVAQLITSPAQLVIEGSFTGLTSVPAPPEPTIGDIEGVIPTAVQLRQTFPDLGQAPDQLTGPTRLFLNVTQTPEAPFSGRFSGILDLRGVGAESDINAVINRNFYLNFTTLDNTTASAARIQIAVVER